MRNTYQISIMNPHARDGEHRLGSWRGCTPRGDYPIVAIDDGVIIVRFATSNGTNIMVVGAPMCTVVEEKLRSPVTVNMLVTEDPSGSSDRRSDRPGNLG